MVYYLGAPTFFFTISSADIHWPEINKIFNIDINKFNSEKELDAYRNKILNENPHIIAYLFQKKFDIFFNDILIKKFNIKDFSYKTEFQHQGNSLYLN